MDLKSETPGFQQKYCIQNINVFECQLSSYIQILFKKQILVQSDITENWVFAFLVLILSSVSAIQYGP